MKKKISIVSSAFNEQDNVWKLYEQVKAEMQKYADRYDYEQILIDNASTDNTLVELRKIAAQDHHFKVIVNNRNFGHIRSPYYVILQATGDAVIYMASDLQDPPELIGSFLSQWEQGYKVVLGQKKSSQESLVFFLVRKFYYWLLNYLNDSGATLVSNCTGFGLYDREVVSTMRKLNDPYPYLRGLVGELGYPHALVPFIQPLRKRGFTKNNFYTLYDNAMIGFTNHSKVPLRMAVFSGVCLGLFSGALALVYLILKLLFWNQFPMGTMPILLAVLVFSAVQLCFLGILGEYVGAILTQVLHRPLVTEKERINFK